MISDLNFRFRLLGLWIGFLTMTSKRRANEDIPNAVLLLHGHKLLPECALATGYDGYDFEQHIICMRRLSRGLLIYTKQRASQGGQP